MNGVVNNRNKIGKTTCSIPISFAISEYFSKYDIRPDEEKDFDTIIWKFISGMPFLFFVWKEANTNRYDDKYMHFVKGSSEIKAIKEFIDGREANVFDQVIKWDNFSKEEKDFLLDRRCTSIIVECDEEVGLQLDKLL